MTQREQILEQVLREAKNNFGKTVTSKISYELIDMILLKLHDYEIIATFNRKWIAKKLNYDKWHSLLWDTLSYNNGLYMIGFICNLDISVNIIFKVMRNACAMGYLNPVKYLYYIGIDKVNRLNIDRSNNIDDLLNEAIRNACVYCNLEVIKFFYSIGEDLTINHIALILVSDHIGVTTQFLYDSDLIQGERLEWTNKYGSKKKCRVKNMHKLKDGFYGIKNVKWI
jgi:hypothetical protein